MFPDRRQAALGQIRRWAKRERRSLEGWRDAPDDAARTPLREQSPEQLLETLSWLELVATFGLDGDQ